MTREELFGTRIEKPDKMFYDRAKEGFDRLAKPIDGLGTFEDMICRIAAVQGTLMPDIERKALIIMCADNGVVAEGVSQTGSEVTAKVAELMGQRKSNVGVMAGSMMVDIIPVDIGINCKDMIGGIENRKIARGTKDMAREKAMTEDETLRAIQCGMDLVKDCHDKGIRMIATGEMGIGNTTTATALLCALTGAKVEDLTGRGAGLTDEGLARKTDVIKRSLKLHKLNNTHKITPSQLYTMNALQAVGGLDIAGIIGVYIGCALYGITGVIDGMISATAALTADYICRGCRDYMLASHRGREKGCQYALSLLGLKSVIDADMALGEGTGAIMVFPLLDMVMNLYREGVRFADTAIMQYERYI